MLLTGKNACRVCTQVDTTYEPRRACSRPRGEKALTLRAFTLILRRSGLRWPAGLMRLEFAPAVMVCGRRRILW
jgi:hypothetical protein